MRRWVALIPLCGCFGSSETPFDPGVEPLESMAIEAPADLEETYALRVEEGDSFIWGHLRGYIHADVASVWAAFQDDEVAVNRRRVASWTTTENAEPEYDFSMALDVVVEDTVTLEYRINWRHGAVGAEDGEPDKVSMRWQKTEGSNLIDLLEGSVLLLPTDEDGITEVQMVERLKAPLTKTDDVESLLVDVFLDATAHANGRELPDLSQD